jgi:anti-sigma B factor antagonist
MQRQAQRGKDETHGRGRGHDRVLRMTLQTSIERIDANTAVIVFVGSVTQGMNLKMTDDQIQALADEGVSRMVLDLTSVPYIDSAGLGVLVHTRGLMRKRGGNLRLCGVTDRVAALLKMTMMDAVLPVDADTAASLAAFPSPAN